MTLVALTSVPPRFGGLGPVLASLLVQRGPARRVVLVIPHAYARFPGTVDLPEVPDGVEILRCEDMGPASKILPVRRAYSGHDILYCDDDCLYGPDWADVMCDSPGLRAGSVFPVARLKRDGGDVAQGFAGVRVPADVALPDDAPEAVRAADDLWLSAWFEAQGCAITEVPEARAMVTPLARSAPLQDAGRAEAYAIAAAFIEARLGLWPRLADAQL